MPEPREWTEDETRNQLLDHIHELVDIWTQAPNQTLHGRLEGLAFSILATLDGGSTVVPGFIVAPDPHSLDKQYNIDGGENYYPENHEANVKGDIAGCLHELFFKTKED